MHLPVLDYELPSERIADVPLEDRAASRLLVAHCVEQEIEHRSFREIEEFLPQDALLVLNDTKVIHARVPVQKATGGAAEILFLSPKQPSRDPAVALQARGSAVWDALVGGKKIRAGDTLRLSASGVDLSAQVLERRQAEATLELQWQPQALTLSEVLERVGQIPLPPYFKRQAQASDRLRYQTVYSRSEGSVAAPTAGLHFTPEVLERLERRGIGLGRVTLHVGAGTFKPIEGDDAREHTMHAERFVVSREFLSRLEGQLRRRLPVIAVGTTSMRTLESLYWTGVRVLQKAAGPWEFLSQWDWQRLSSGGTDLPEASDAIAALLGLLGEKGLAQWEGETQIMIAPGYPFPICQGLVTNFHQPRSTLLLLVAAFAGEAFWREIYRQALEKPYRFLSYGDSSLLLRRVKHVSEAVQRGK